MKTYQGTAHYHYNPDWLSDEDLLANFVARLDEFNFLRDELARAPREGSAQHYLLVGVRGAGKTTLLKRLAVAIRQEEKLKDHLIALSFPEELYQVKHLADFWWVACEALADELDRQQNTQQADALIAAIDQGRIATTDPLSDNGLKLLLQTCAGLQRRPVLLVDNLDMVFQRIDKSGRKLKDPHAPAYWALREALSTTTSPIVIGGSVRLSEPFTDYDKAFYDFFLPKRLGKLDIAEARKVLERLADAQNLPEVKERLRTRPSRVEALHELTGGNPRAIGLIFELLRQGPNSRAVEDFERLMDITTPYYKARFEDLSEQAQVIMHALAVRRPGDGGLRFGHTAAEIGVHAGLPTGTVSAQLDVLEREGLMEKSAAHGRTQYRIAEQLFRLWLQMRGNRRIRQNVIGLTEFLEAMFDFEEMRANLPQTGTAPLSDARYAFMLADACHAEPMRRGLEAHGADCLLNHMKACEERIEDYLPASDLPEDLAAVVRMRDELRQHPGCGLSGEDKDALLGSVELSLEQKQAGVRKLCEADTAAKEADRLRLRLAGERERLMRYGLHEDDLALLYAKRARGFLPLPWLTPEDAKVACMVNADATACREMVWRLLGARESVKFANEQAAQSWLAWGLAHAGTASSAEWANVAGAMRRSRQFSSAKQVMDRAFALGISSRAWFERGALLDETEGDAMEVEAAYREAIRLDPADAWPWIGLGNLLTSKPNRYEEAEAAYREAIGLDPALASPWNNLGNLLASELNRPEEAETAYRKAIELDPALAPPWNNLGALLASKLNLPEEAETAYRKAIELDPTYAGPWYNLGILLADKLNRPEEAETAHCKAIELDPDDAWPWNKLGNLLADKLNRPKEAEAAYRKAIELDPVEALPYLNLGLLLAAQGRLEEADATYGRGAELDKNLHPWWREHSALLQTRFHTCAARQALDTNHLPALRVALSRLLSESADLTIALVSNHFVEDFLAPVLRNKAQAQTLLATLRELGYEKHARPLLLACSAALEGRPDMLAELEPELQGAARRMFERLTGDQVEPPAKRIPRKKTKRKQD